MALVAAWSVTIIGALGFWVVLILAITNPSAVSSHEHSNATLWATGIASTFAFAAFGLLLTFIIEEFVEDKT